MKNIKIIVQNLNTAKLEIAKNAYAYQSICLQHTHVCVGLNFINSVLLL